MMKFETKDSGKRQEFTTGMKRDLEEGKPRYDLIIPLNMKEPMIKRWAELMARGANKYGERNWEKAETNEEMLRYKSSLLRHVIQLVMGETDEDHAAAVMFNVQGLEYVKERLKQK